MNFNDVKINQEVLCNLITNVINNDKISHAYLFAGENGTGKLDLAKYFVAMHYCMEDEKPCGECILCKNILEDQFMNSYIIDKDKILKQDIINLQQHFSHSSLQDGKRFYIINNADLLNQESANSLLKFIEEPSSDNVVAILLTSRLDSVLTTIKSRCQILHLKPVKKSRWIHKFEEEGYDETLISLLFNITNSNMKVLEYIRDDAIISIYELVKKFANSLNLDKTDIIKDVYDIETLISTNKLYRDFLFNCLLTLYKDILSVKFNYDKITFKEQYEQLIHYSRSKKTAELQGYINGITDVHYKYNYNVNKRLTFTNLVAVLTGGV